MVLVNGKNKMKSQNDLKIIFKIFVISKLVINTLSVKSKILILKKRCQLKCNLILLFVMLKNNCICYLILEK